LGPCLLSYIFFRILFRIRRVIRIRNSYYAMGHWGGGGGPHFLQISWI
jgi:hypothetical protein